MIYPSPTYVGDLSTSGGLKRGTNLQITNIKIKFGRNQNVENQDNKIRILEACVEFNSK